MGILHPKFLKYKKRKSYKLGRSTVHEIITTKLLTLCIIEEIALDVNQQKIKLTQAYLILHQENLTEYYTHIYLPRRISCVDLAFQESHGVQ